LKEIGFIMIDRKQPLSDEVAQQCHRAVQSVLATMGERTRQLLSDHRPALDRIVDSLMEKNRLLKHEILELMQSEISVAKEGGVQEPA
jgi:ATP-dependent Zn protease